MNTTTRLQIKPILALYFLLALLCISSCQKEDDPVIDLCADGEWGQVERDGEEICFPDATAFYYEANTPKANFVLQLGTFGTPGAISLSAKFDVPVSGLELNKVYTLSSGDFYGTEDLVSGEMTILSYEPIKDGNYCASGIFNMITENPNSGGQTVLTNGKFLSQRGFENCNPF